MYTWPRLGHLSSDLSDGTIQRSHGFMFWLILVGSHWYDFVDYFVTQSFDLPDLACVYYVLRFSLRVPRFQSLPVRLNTSLNMPESRLCRGFAPVSLSGIPLKRARGRNGIRQVDVHVKMPEMDEQECSVEAFWNWTLGVLLVSFTIYRYIWFRGIQNGKRHSESKQSWDTCIYLHFPRGNISGWFPAWPVLYFNGSMRRKRGCQCGRQHIKPMQSNTLCAPQFRMPGGALDIYAYVDNETPEEEHTKKIIAGLDCWIAGRWTTSVIFACRCQKRPQRIFDHIKRTFRKRQ